MPTEARGNIRYTDLFIVLGKFITDKNMKDVCVMEFEDGVIVTGSVIYDARGGYRREQETYVLSASELGSMIDSSDSSKRGLFGR
ncbi:MAG: hypothetical protein HY741_03345 [Chloroflexi bacterium]|nr:hypothetical protein [Chloroflexota bacterium]